MSAIVDNLETKTNKTSNMYKPLGYIINKEKAKNYSAF